MIHRLLALAIIFGLLAGPAAAQTGNFKQIIMQDVTGAFIRAPRITQSQRDASTHNAGEIIYCTDCAPADLYLYTGSAWVSLAGGGGGGGAVASVGGTTGQITVDPSTGNVVASFPVPTVLMGQTLAPVADPTSTATTLSVAGQTSPTDIRQYVGSFSLNSSHGAFHTGVNRDKVALYAGAAGGSSSGDIRALRTVTSSQDNSGDYSIYGAEIKIKNDNAHRGDNDADTGLGAPVAFGIDIIGTGASRATSAISITGLGTPVWNRGIVISNNAMSATGSSFQDLSSPHKSIDIRGLPQYGIYQDQGAVKNLLAGGAILGPVASVGLLPAAGVPGRVMALLDGTLRMDNGVTWIIIGPAPTSTQLNNDILVMGSPSGVISMPTRGTSFTLLHGNLTGPPTFGPVDLGTDVTGVMPPEQFPGLTGDVTAPPGSFATTMKNTGQAGTYSLVTTDAQGRVTSGIAILDVPHGGTGSASGNSGGIPYYSSATTMGTTAQLGDGLPVLGGGAGAPFSGTRSGNTTAYVTSSGTLTPGTCTQWDANGNATSSGAACGSGGGGGQGVTGTLFTSTASGTVANTATEGSIVGTGVGSKSTPANYFQVGTTLAIDVTGYGSWRTQESATVRVVAGATEVFTSGPVNLGTHANSMFRLLLQITCRTIGTSGTFIANTFVETVHSDGTSMGLRLLRTTPVTLNTTTSLLWDVLVQWSAADIADSMIGTNAVYYTPGTGLPDPGANGLLARTSLNGVIARTITGAAPIVVTSGDGVNGNPLISITTPIASALGGTGISTSASTGVPTITAGTWSVAATLPASLFPGLTGDVTAPAGSTATVLSLTGVAAGTYGQVTVDTKGRVLSAVAIADPAHGGLGINTSAATGVPSVASGVWSVAPKLSPNLGGTGLNTAPDTGVPTITAGVWSVLPALPTSLGGTGTTGGPTGEVTYWSPSGLTSSGAFKWDSTNTVLNLGTGGTGPVSAGSVVLTATGNAVVSGSYVARIEASTGAGNLSNPRTALQLVRSTTGVSNDGFAIRQDFILRDSDATDVIAARMISARAVGGVGPDTSMTFDLLTRSADSLASRFFVNPDGSINIPGRIGIGAQPNSSGQMYIVGTETSPIVAIYSTAATSLFSGGLVYGAQSTGQMVDGFGPAIAFRGIDVDSNNGWGEIGYIRAGSDGTAALTIRSTIAGVSAERIGVDNTGAVKFTSLAGSGSAPVQVNSAGVFSRGSGGAGGVGGTGATGNAAYWLSPSTVAGDTGIIYAAAFGTSRGNIQSAINAAPSGGIVQLECITYTLDGIAITIPKILTLRGCQARNTGTMLVGGASTVISLSGEGGKIESMVIIGAAGQTAVAITGVSDAVIRDVLFTNAATAIAITNSVGTQIDNCRFVFITAQALYFTAPAGADGGDHSIVNSVFVDGGINAPRALFWDSSGGIRFINNKIISAPNSTALFFDLSPTATQSTGDFIISNNSIEGGTGDVSYGVRFRNSHATHSLVYISISGNQIANAGHSISVEGPRIGALNIYGNQMTSFANPGIAIYVDGSDRFSVSSNVINGGGVNFTGISIGSTALNGCVLGNAFGSVTTKVGGPGNPTVGC